MFVVVFFSPLVVCGRGGFPLDVGRFHWWRGWAPGLFSHQPRLASLFLLILSLCFAHVELRGGRRLVSLRGWGGERRTPSCSWLSSL